MPTSVNSPASTRKSWEKAWETAQIFVPSTRQEMTRISPLAFGSARPCPQSDCTRTPDCHTSTTCQDCQGMPEQFQTSTHQQTSTILRLRKAFHDFLWSLSRFSLFQRPLATLMRATEALGQNGTHQRAYKLRLQL